MTPVSGTNADETPLELPEVMPLALAAKLLGVTAPTLKRAIDRGELRASPLRGRGTGQLNRWVVQRRDVLAYLDAAADAPRTPRREPDVEAARAMPARRRRRATAGSGLDLPIPGRRAA